MGKSALPLGGWFFYESGWCIDETGHLRIEIAIPFNAWAKFVLPQAQMSEVSINGHSLYEGEQLGDSVELTLGAGDYEIEYLFCERDT